MLKRLYTEKHIEASAAKIREILGNNTKYKVSQIPDGIEAVYEAGKAAGGGSGGTGGSTLVPSEGFTYFVSDDWTCYIESDSNCTDEVVVIPTISPDGLLVIGINSNALSRDMKQLIFPDIITSLPTWTVVYTPSLEYIKFGKYTTTIDGDFSASGFFASNLVLDFSDYALSVPPGLGSSMLSSLATEIRVPVDMVDVWKTATNWSVAADKIVGVQNSATGSDWRDLYQRVEYIKSDGSSYILTDFVADNTCGVEIIASFPVLQDRVPMGSRVDSGSTRFYCAYPLSASSCYYGFDTGASFSCALSVNTPYRLQTNFLNSRLTNVYDINGTRKGGTSISETLTQQTCPVAIFGYNYASTGAISSKREFLLYSARCSRGHEVEREYIPCYRKSDGVIGLYEKVTGTFLTNQGTGSFTKGADVDW